MLSHTVFAQVPDVLRRLGNRSDVSLEHIEGCNFTSLQLRPPIACSAEDGRVAGHLLMDVEESKPTDLPHSVRTFANLHGDAPRVQLSAHR
jgi:hypothetical protein